VAKWDVNGIVGVVDAVGVVKDGGRAGTEGGDVVEDDDDDDGPVPVFAEAEVVLGVLVGAGEEVLGAGTDVDAAAAAPMVPLRSQGFGGDPIVSNRRGTNVESAEETNKSLCECEYSNAPWMTRSIRFVRERWTGDI
jgi:hypothetical protein